MQQPTAQQQLQHNYKQGLQQHPNPAQKQQQQLSFANEGQLLLLNAASLSDVAARMAAKHATPATPDGAASSTGTFVTMQAATSEVAYFVSPCIRLPMHSFQFCGHNHSAGPPHDLICLFASSVWCLRRPHSSQMP
jgi:hypothetical protein